MIQARQPLRQAEPWFIPPDERRRNLRTQPPRTCDRCGCAQSIHRSEGETLCAPCQRRRRGDAE